jgi:hypothetical protein
MTTPHIPLSEPECNLVVQAKVGLGIQAFAIVINCHRSRADKALDDGIPLHLIPILL